MAAKQRLRKKRKQYLGLRKGGCGCLIEGQNTKIQWEKIWDFLMWLPKRGWPLNRDTT